jgi:hypothetical protein
MLPSAQAARRVGKAEDHVVGAGGQAGDGGLVEYRNAGSGQGLIQRGGQVAGTGHVAEGRLTVFAGLQHGSAQAALVGDMDGLDGRSR